MKSLNLKKMFLIAMIVMINCGALKAQTEIESNNEEALLTLETRFAELTQDRADKIKEGSRPFVLSQNKKAPTVVMLHGLSDSPGSLKEVSKVYYKLGYNVLTVLLADHGLLAPYRNEYRLKVTLADWRANIDKLMGIAFSISDSSKVALVGYSLGGALATDTANRYAGKISSLVVMAPLYKMIGNWAAPVTKVLKRVKYTVKKGVPETEFFYPDFTFNQISQIYKLTQHLKKNVAQKDNSALREIPKMMFLTDADTTIENEFAYKTAKKINISADHIIMYNTIDKNNLVLHRDLPMRLINASQTENPFIDDLLERLESFLESNKERD